MVHWAVGMGRLKSGSASWRGAEDEMSQGLPRGWGGGEHVAPLSLCAGLTAWAIPPPGPPQPLLHPAHKQCRAPGMAPTQPHPHLFPVGPRLLPPWGSLGLAQAWAAGEEGSGRGDKYREGFSGCPLPSSGGYCSLFHIQSSVALNSVPFSPPKFSGFGRQGPP